MKALFKTEATCTRCGRTKPAADFGRRGTKLREYCKMCQSEENRLSYLCRIIGRKRRRFKDVFEDLEFEPLDQNQKENAGNILTIEDALRRNKRLVQFILKNSKLDSKRYSRYVELETLCELHNVKYEKSFTRVVTSRFNFSSFSSIPNLVKALLEDTRNKLDIDYEGYGLVFNKILHFKFKFSRFKESKGGCFKHLPKVIEDLKCCRNPKNTDNACAIWCLKEYFSMRKLDQQPNHKDVDLPLKVSDVPKLERLNKLNINVFVLNEISKKLNKKQKKIQKNLQNFKYPNNLMVRRIYPFKFRRIEPNDVNLLLYKKHYSLITDLGRLTGFEENVCFNCDNTFSTRDQLAEHELYCKNYEACKVSLTKNKFLRFENLQNKVSVPFIIYSDFESVLEEISEKQGTMLKTQKHVPSAFAFFTVCRPDERHNNFKLFSGQGAAAKFVEMLISELVRIRQIMEVEKSINMTRENEVEFEEATNCYLCGNLFSVDDEKVRDHCHISGKYRGAAHNSCNLTKLRQKNFVPIVFHNLEGYDSHLFIKELSKVGDIDIIPKTTEKYISFTVNFDEPELHNSLKARFIDSFLFLSASLEELGSNLHSFKYIKNKEYCKKQYYPYDYINSFERLSEPNLPPIECFYSKMKEEGITEEQYAHACKVFRDQGCKSIEDYQNFYLRIDVLLLAEVFEEFRTLAIADYELDPANYVSLPSYSWDACLKFTGVSLHTLQDLRILDLFDGNAIRGGISTVCEKCYATADIDHQIIYLDANNLYGHSMSQPLPLGDFVDRPDLSDDLSLSKIRTTLSMNTYDINTDMCIKQKSYILVVDVDYPSYLHPLHNAYPLMPEHLNGKLCPNLFNKRMYLVHARNLLFYIDHGLVLRKIHRVLEFTESNWLKNYIDFNTRKRAASKTDFEKRFYKLLNNSVYGKTMENIRKRVNMKLVRTSKQAQRAANSLLYKRYAILDDDLAVVELYKSEIVYNKPIYLGFIILELSKLHMYTFHYDVMLANFNLALLYTDTDSLIYEVETRNFFEDCERKGIMGYFDTKDDKMVGKFKDEFAKTRIVSFVALQSKTYSVLTAEDTESHKCKGVKKSVIKKAITHENFKEALFQGKEMEVRFYIFKTEKHDVKTVRITKMALTPKDDKRERVPGTVLTRAPGFAAIS